MRTFNYSGSRQSGDSQATRPFPVALDVLKEAAIIHTTAFSTALFATCRICNAVRRESAKSARKTGKQRQFGEAYRSVGWYWDCVGRS
jgi:hypothetical protein